MQLELPFREGDVRHLHPRVWFLAPPPDEVQQVIYSLQGRNSSVFFDAYLGSEAIGASDVILIRSGSFFHAFLPNPQDGSRCESSITASDIGAYITSSIPILSRRITLNQVHISGNGIPLKSKKAATHTIGFYLHRLRSASIRKNPYASREICKFLLEQFGEKLSPTIVALICKAYAKCSSEIDESPSDSDLQDVFSKSLSRAAKFFKASGKSQQERRLSKCFKSENQPHLPHLEIEQTRGARFPDASYTVREFPAVLVEFTRSSQMADLVQNHCESFYCAGNLSIRDDILSNLTNGIKGVDCGIDVRASLEKDMDAVAKIEVGYDIFLRLNIPYRSNAADGNFEEMRKSTYLVSFNSPKNIADCEAKVVAPGEEFLLHLDSRKGVRNLGIEVIDFGGQSCSFSRRLTESCP
ncbi:hypothetical protein [Alloyangia pacifica]|uniref:hypothetical protein n=1 Tax=Alloyangia pacifica TaxID=311180 RepID=UPI001CD74EE0|nr:hypothetical protein [Alloyangia pacifica]MCA0996845.1 hypothetical protein [Alloyangia pacifica]